VIGNFRTASLVLVLLPADVAHALSPTEIGSAFLQGVLQPALKPVHALTLLALGLLFGRCGHAAWGFLATFAAALAAGLTAIALAAGATPAVDILLASAALAGLFVASQWSLPKFVGWLMAAMTGAAIGLDSPPTATSIAAANATLVGSGIGACLVLAASAGGALLIRYDWQRIGLRIVGSWIAASAILVLAGSVISDP
jgi:urease accessory protein